MEINFYKNKGYLVGALIGGFICNLIVIYVCILVKDIKLYIVLIFWIMFMIIIFLLSYRFIFSKVCINQNGIVWSIPHKEIYRLEWESINSLKKTYIYRTQSIIFNYVDGNSNQELYFNASKNLLKRIIAICPDERINKMLKSLKLRQFP